MALALSAVHTKSMALQCLSSSQIQSERFLTVQSISTTLSFPPRNRKPLFCSLLVSSRHRNLTSTIAAASSSSKRKKKQNLSHNHVDKGGEEEDAFELLFKQLEEDLKNDGLSKDDSDDEISEEDLAIFERELEDAMGEIDAEMVNSVINDTETGNDPKEEDEKDDNDGGDEGSVKLKNWQMRRLAKALKAGRRKISIKNLAAELCLDRALVLELLRDPPPNLLMMSLSLPDELPATVISPETKPIETVHEKTSMDRAKSESKAELPVHAMQRNWFSQKRLKKVHVATLEKCYRRSKRPTDAMISSIIFLTNLPRKRIVKWFEDKRAEEGVRADRVPYLRSASGST